MKFSRFKIKDFRCFSETQSLKFAIPIEDREGSGITYIVGQNNAGKTTVLEGIFYKETDKIRQSDKRGEGPEFTLFELEQSHERAVRTVKLVRETSYTLAETGQIHADFRFEIIQSRRGWKSEAHHTQDQTTIIESNKNSEKPRSDTNFQIASFLKSIERDEAQYNAFIRYVQRVLPDFHSFAIGNDDYEYIEYRTQEGHRHRSDFLGDGVISVLRILAHLHIAGANPIVIDEPELSLHPSAQRRLLSLIAEASRTRQIIVATHSPYFVSWEYIENGATLNRVFKEDARHSRICSLQDYSAYKALISGANWQQPFLMDVVAKEIFFHDSILFVEGQEDVGLLGREKSLVPGVNLFGYGVRGKDAFRIALQLAKDLGIKKAGVLLDNGKSEREVKASLEADFSDTGYQVFQWDKEDIRDKEAFHAREKSGYFTSKGEKKAAAELGDYDQKILAIRNYFGN